jgi:hypothetical protein
MAVSAWNSPELADAGIIFQERYCFPGAPGKIDKFATNGS